jgi:hypothetical protein
MKQLKRCLQQLKRSPPQQLKRRPKAVMRRSSGHGNLFKG